MFCFTVPCVREVVDYVSKLVVRARVHEICQGVRCLVWRGGVYLFLVLRSRRSHMWFECLYVFMLFFCLA
jgi:hypothetical protein